MVQGDAAVADPGPGRGLGARIRGVRAERGLSTRELAARVGCSASLISQIERGATAPSAGMAYQLANQLNTSLDYLFGVAPPAGAQASAPEPAEPAEPAGPAEPAAEVLAAVSVRRRDGAPAWPAPADSLVQRAENRRCIELAGGVRWERLTPSSDPYVDFLQVTYAPCGHTKDPSVGALRHDGREYGLVLDGRLRADVGFETYHLEPGDSITFDSSSPHAYLNETDDYVQAIWFIVHREPWRA